MALVPGELLILPVHCRQLAFMPAVPLVQGRAVHGQVEPGRLRCRRRGLVVADIAFPSLLLLTQSHRAHLLGQPFHRLGRNLLAHQLGHLPRGLGEAVVHGQYAASSGQPWTYLRLAQTAGHHPHRRTTRHEHGKRGQLA